ncbi:MAG: RIP metalloprotease RseP, partial [Candidatus Hydrogenedentes bacterium]|nr:RIP metalloprotease RseP [Candidatus Hydrogenedentota bacterium]
QVPEWEMEARVGIVEPGSPAEEAPLYLSDGTAQEERSPDAIGWQVGDRILTIDGREASNMTDLAIAAVLGGKEREQKIEIERTLENGDTVRYLSVLTPRTLDESGHARFGVGPYETATVRKVFADSAAAQAGFQKGDIIRAVDDERVTLTGFIGSIEEVEEGSTVAVSVVRDEALLVLEVQPQTTGRFQGFMLDADDPDKDPARILHITAAMQEETGLRKRDVITAVNGNPVTLTQLVDLQESSPGETLEFKVDRPQLLFGLMESASTFTAEVPVASVRAIGVALAPKTVLQRVPVAKIVPHAFYQSYLAVERTVLTIVGLARGTVSPKDLGGPVMIFDVTTKAAEAGLGWLIKITAFISINLFILNLLPLPVLDGGQVVVNAVETVLGKPLNERMLERMQQVGIAMLLSLMLFVTYNDISRLVQSWLP